MTEQPLPSTDMPTLRTANVREAAPARNTAKTCNAQAHYSIT